ncbi:hypothetical protein B0H16DRAFT_1828528 [Mycena metata]|uniref:Ubiquitin-like protease family profile domain-containing protein n=1 Tax=Mycena metata TaxID=1033252 RepID=A0AAD7GSG5_9AGAR|nr:hypothetical protein B0H16DRAFT_1828528 [Mycena metata]
MPLELLTDIWMYSNQSPVSLMRICHVSKSWSTARSIASLWDTLNLTEKTPIGLIPLWLEFSFGTGVNSPRNSDVDVGYRQTCQVFIRLMDILDPAHPRWRSLIIRGPQYLGPILKPYVDKSRSYTQLTTLWILLQPPSNHLNSGIADDTSVLHMQPVRVIDAAVANYALQWETLPFNVLESLVLGPHLPDNILLSWDAFAAALDGTVTMLSLAFCGTIPAHNDAAKGPDTMVLRCVTALTLSRLTDAQVEHVLNFVSLPHVRSLALRLPHEESNFSATMQRLPVVFPTLNTLCIENLWMPAGDPGIKSLFTAFAHTDIIDLRLNFELADGLYTHTWGSGISSEFWNAFIQASASPAFLPRLHFLTLINVPLVNVQDLLLVRARAAAPKLNITLRFTDSSTTTQYVRWKTWLIDNTTELTLTSGPREMWTLGDVHERNMGKSPGRPANSTPLQAGRSQAVVSFSKPRGRKPAARLAANSLFPSTVKPNPRPAPGSIDDGAFQAEELSMYSGDLRRWAPLEYFMRVEEGTQWALLLNCSEIARREGWWFVVGYPQCITPNLIERLRWSISVDVEELRSRKLGYLADVLADRPNNQLNHLVCLHLRFGHWSVFHHDLTLDEPRTMRLNPLQENSEWNELEPGLRHVDIQDQAVLRTYLNHRRAAVGSEPWPAVKIEDIDTSYEEIFLGIQRSDSTTCGFWCILIVFSLFFQFDLEHPLVHSMDHMPANLKELLAPIYGAFGADPVGVPVELLQQLFLKLEPAFDFASLQNLHFSERPAGHERLDPHRATAGSAFHAAGPPAPPIPSLALGPAVLDPGVSDLLVDNMKDATWLIGDRPQHRPSSSNIRDLVGGGELHNVVMDAFLDLFVQDLHAEGWVGPSFLITDSIVGNELQTLSKNPAGMPPKRTGKTGKDCQYWFQQDIFLLNALLIPWFGRNIGCYYKSLHGQSRATAATERVYQMLLFEHNARKKVPLEATWCPDVVLARVPQQTNLVDCGVYTIWSITQLTRGRWDTTLWEFSREQAAEQRIRVANQLSLAIHAHSSRRNTRQLGGLLGDESSDSGSSDSTQTCEDERNMVETMSPRLPSTNVVKLPTIQQWESARQRRLETPEVGTCMLYDVPTANNETRLYPYIVRGFDDHEVVLVRFEGTYPRNIFTAPNISLTPLEWPRLLATPFEAFYPSPLFPYQQRLADYLGPLVPVIAAIYLQSEGRTIHKIPGSFSYGSRLSLATSVYVERQFSRGRLLISSIRNRLTGETGRMLMCLGCWSQQGFVDSDDISAVAKMPDIEPEGSGKGKEKVVISV